MMEELGNDRFESPDSGNLNYMQTKAWEFELHAMLTKAVDPLSASG
jgi:hypothetical protein